MPRMAVETSGFSRLRVLGMMLVVVVMMMMNFDFSLICFSFFPGGLNRPNGSC